MSTTRSQDDKSGSSMMGGRIGWLAAGLLLVVVVVPVAYFSMVGEAEGTLASDVPTFEVKEGPLTISVIAAGSLRSGDAAVITNQVEGQTTILYIIDEGTMVKEGDLLVELDSADLVDREIDQAIRVQSAEANLTTAQLNLEIAAKQGASNIQTAEVALELAILDLEKYAGADIGAALGVVPSVDGRFDVKEFATKLAGIKNVADLDLERYKLLDEDGNQQGEYQQEVMTADNQIVQLDSQLERARDQLEGSVKLYEKGYITETELQADQLDEQRYRLDKQLAEAKRQLLERYTFRRQMAQLQSAVAKAAFDLEKSEHEAKASIADKTATLSSQQLTFNREEDRLENIRAQLVACKVYATDAGMVVHGTSADIGGRGTSRSEPLDEGVAVRQRQELIRLVKGGNMLADIKIHESQIDKVRAGQPVLLTTDAVKNKTFRGRVNKVALMAAAQDRWLNPDLRVYDTEIVFEESTSELRPGMSVNAEIVVERFDNAMYVPIQSVLEEGATPTVYVLGKNGPESREVETGLDNNRFVRIVAGLTPGDPVLLNPPLSAAERTIDAGALLDMAEERSREVGAVVDEMGGTVAVPVPGQRRGGGQGAGGQGGGFGGAGGQGGQGAGGFGGFGEMTDEQREAMRARFENMSDEDRAAMRANFQGGGQGAGGQGGAGGFGGGGAGGPGGGADRQNMTDEERAQMRQRFQRGGAGGGGANDGAGGGRGGFGGGRGAGGAGDAGTR